MEHENELKEALDFLSPSALNYEEWTTVGMALKQAGFPVSAWEQWSARDAGRYHKGECTRKWESFHGSAQPVTENSIFQLAYQQGWTGPAGHALDWGGRDFCRSQLLCGRKARRSTLGRRPRSGSPH